MRRRPAGWLARHRLAGVADPHGYRPAPGSIPESPGVYRFRDAHGRVIYVGKAKSLRSRLNSYFADFASLHPRTQRMVTTAAAVEWTVVGTEVEALQLEYTWIKEFDPRFNVRYRDDKTYPLLAVTLDEEYPRLQVMRGAKRKGVRYFGPYSHAWAIRETLDMLLRVFPARTCSAGVFKRAGQIGRPCLLGYIGKCSAPCVGRVSADEHRGSSRTSATSWPGRPARFIRRLEARDARGGGGRGVRAGRPAARRHRALRRAMEKQAVVLGDGTDGDVVAFAEDQLEAAVQVFHVRGGRVRGQRGWVVDKVEDVTPPSWSSSSWARSTARTRRCSGGDVPAQRRRRTAVPARGARPGLPPDADGVADGCAARRGSRVSLRVPQRGDKRALLETVARNAAESLTQHKTQARQRPDHPQPRAARDPGGARAGRGAAADRVLRRVQPAGHQRGRVAWSCSRTACPARASTAGSHQGRRRRATTSPRSTR